MSPSPSKPPSTPPPTLTATYTSPTTSHTFTHPLPPTPIHSTQQKTIYLSALRKSVTQLQDDINTFLTSRMEEDKTLAADAGVKGDEKAEEEGYGEERVEEGV